MGFTAQQNCDSRSCKCLTLMKKQKMLVFGFKVNFFLPHGSSSAWLSLPQPHGGLPRNSISVEHLANCPQLPLPCCYHEAVDGQMGRGCCGFFCSNGVLLFLSHVCLLLLFAWAGELSPGLLPELGCFPHSLCLSRSKAQEAWSSIREMLLQFAY